MNNSGRPKFTEQQVDQLLEAFYAQEIPQKLDQPPSSWPQIAATEPQVAVQSTLPVKRPQSGRGIAVAVATLAASLLIVTLSRFTEPVAPEVPGTVEVVPPEGGHPEELMNVSGGEATEGAVDDRGLTVGELDQIDITPPSGPGTGRPDGVD